MTKPELEVVERFFLPFSTEIDRLNELKKQKSFRDVNNKFTFEYHAIEPTDGEPVFQVLFDFNGGRIQQKLFLASDYELFDARIEGIRDIFWAMR